MADEKPERQWLDPSLAKLHAGGDAPVTGRYLAGLLDHLLAVIVKTFETTSEKSAEHTVKRIDELEREWQSAFEAMAKRIDASADSTMSKLLEEHERRIQRHAEHLARLETRVTKLQAEGRDK